MAEEIKIVFKKLEDEEYVKLVKLLRLMEEMQLIPKLLVVSRRQV